MSRFFLRPFDATGAFRAFGEGEGEGLRRLAVRGAGVTVASSVITTATQIASTVVLARLLLPRDFGVVAMVTTFSLLLMNFGLNGFTEAVVQRDNLDSRLASNLFWINVGAGALLTFGFAATGPLLARFYHDPLVAHITAGISLTILFTSAQVIHLALLKRAMRFSQIAVNDIFSRALAVGVSICLAWQGWGYWALVAGAVVQPFSACLAAWLQCRWMPGLPQKADGTGSMVKFAINVYGRFSFNYFSRNTDNVLVGWCFSAQLLGFYKRAYDLFALSAGLLTSSLTGVAVSALSRLHHDSVQYRRYLLSALAVIALVGMGLAGDLTLTGMYIIRLLLGPGWEPAGRIFTFFGPGIGMMLLYGATGWIHLSIGTPERWFRWGFLEFGVTALLFILGLHWGPPGIAMAWTASFWILTLPAFWYAGKPIGLTVTSVLSVIWKYIVASALAASAAAVIIHTIHLSTVLTSFDSFVRIVVMSLLFGIFYVVAVVVLHWSSAPLYEVAGLVEELLPSRRLAKSASRAAALAAMTGKASS